MEYEVSLRGISPLLMHQDNIPWADSMKKWQKDPDNKGKSTAGDDRSPAWTWLGSLHHNGDVVTLPGEMLMRCAMAGGTQVLVPGAKGNKTFKEQTQSGMVILEEHVPLFVRGEVVRMEPLLALLREEDFAVHEQAAIQSRFALFVKRARVGANKHVRVRPRFEEWEAKFILEVWDDDLTLAALTNIWRIAGAKKGLGDWRPSAKTPGPFGRFEAAVVKKTGKN